MILGKTTYYQKLSSSTFSAILYSNVNNVCCYNICVASRFVAIMYKFTDSRIQVSHVINVVHRYLLHNSHLVNLASFLRALHFLGEDDVDVDEVQCIIANLIDKVNFKPEPWRQTSVCVHSCTGVMIFGEQMIRY